MSPDQGNLAGGPDPAAIPMPAHPAALCPHGSTLSWQFPRTRVFLSIPCCFPSAGFSTVKLSSTSTDFNYIFLKSH